MVTQWGSLYVLVGPDEIGDVVRRAVAEWDGDPETLAVISCPEEALDEKRPVVVCVEPGEEDTVPAGFSDQRTVIRLLERL